MRESFYIAMIVLATAFWLNKRYEYVGKSLAFLGNISFMLYLCHRRITWVLLSSVGLRDVIIWIFVSICVAYAFKSIYGLMTRNTRFSRCDKII